MKALKSPSARLLPVLLSIFGAAMGLALPFAAQQRPNSPVAPVKPSLPNGALASEEKLIKLPPDYTLQAKRVRRTTDTLPPLSEEQKILHLLNRAGYGPRPGDIERVRQMGINRYIEEQLSPEEIPDELLSRPLLALKSLHLSIPETMQTFTPPPPRATPTPTPTPAPAPVPTPSINLAATLGQKGENNSEMGKDEPGKGKAMMPQNPGEAMLAQSSTPQSSTPQQTQMPAPNQVQPQQNVQRPTPTPTPGRDPQQPLRELQQAKLLRAVYSERQLQEVMVDFWINHFNVFASKDSVRWMTTSYERDAIRPYALGKFKELLLAVAQSPAMLYYLDNFLSQAEVKAEETKTEKPGEQEKGNSTGSPLSRPPASPLAPAPTPTPVPARRAGLNENYARELMELHTLGVDGGYTQQDVIEVARCFTGWTVVSQPNSSFVFRPRLHDRGEKIVLGTRIGAGGGIEDGLRVLNLLAKHPSTAKFIAFKLCQRFVADEPPQALVDRIAGVYEQTDGDIREVVRAILTAPEFYSPKYYRNKIKSPLELTASALRATGASSDATLTQWVARMGEPLYLCSPPTGYSEDSSRWMSNATLLERMNFAVALIGNKINGTRVDVSRLVTPDVVREKEQLLNQLLAVLVHSDVSHETRTNLAHVIEESRGKMTPAKFDDRVAQKNNEQLIVGLSALILGSREFQVK